MHALVVFQEKPELAGWSTDTEFLVTTLVDELEQLVSCVCVWICR